MTIDKDSANRHPPPRYESNMGEEKERTASPAYPYIYYRVYTMDGAVPSKTAPNPQDPFIGRMAVTSVPPPHNVATLQRCLASAEGFSDIEGRGERTTLFESPVALSQMPSKTSLELRGRDRDIHGGTQANALVLKVIDDLTAAEAAAVESIDRSQYSVCGPFLYYPVYYHLYTRVGEDTSTLSFDANQPAIGCIERSHIAPPFTPASIRRCIAKAERKPVYAYFSAVYADIMAQKPLHDHMPIRAEVGVTEGDPIVLVQPERKKGLFNRQVELKAALVRLVFTTGHPRVLERRPEPVPAMNPTRASGYGS
ncbi:hypothetical protein FB45DRAFT_820840 [Roridomyces roridus]|uniref:Uncharacterized protein n=1 Tax=Roridomyces roridus TaxID=1738132 RepID=A0AAD7CL60_9AGAR|nr:hypothetical protein FB45DRAFT_820840 [Roridomyces roridus]